MFALRSNQLNCIAWFWCCFSDFRFCTWH